MWSSIQSRRKNFRNFSRIYLFQSSQKIASGIACLHSHAHLKPDSNHSELWFVKVVCTICFRNWKKSFDVFHSDYFRRNLSALIAFDVIQRLSSDYHNPELAYSFFQFTKLNLNLIHSSANYNMLLSSFCQMGLHDLAKLVFEFMKNDGHFPDSSILGYLVTSFAHADMLDDAKRLLSDAELHDIEIRPFVYNDLLTLLMKHNRVEAAVCFLREHILRSSCYCPDTCTFNIVIRGLCKVGEVDKAFGFFNDMGNFGCLPDIRTYNILINGLCRVGEVDRGLQLLRDVKSGNGYYPDVVTYTSVISGYCKSGKMKAASQIFDEMITSGIKPSLVTFNVLIDGFGKNSDMTSALNIYQRMLFLGCLPDVVSFSSLIDGHCRTGQVDEGLKLWDEMHAKNISANLYTFCILINALCKENRISEARDLLAQVKRRDDIVPQAFIYNPVIDGFCKAGNVDEANVIVTEMEAKRCKPDKLTFTILIIGYCMKGRMSEAINIFNKMFAIGCFPDKITINNLTSRLLKAGMPNEAFRIMQTVPEDLNLGKPSFRRNVPTRTKMEIPVAA